MREKGESYRRDLGEREEERFRGEREREGKRESKHRESQEVRITERKERKGV